jgi:hypothetical protein
MKRSSAVLLVFVAACAGADRRAPAPHGSVTGVELAAFEVRDDGVDRFEHCPPAGEIGQEWVPMIPDWRPPAASASAAVPASAADGAQGDGATEPQDADANKPATQHELTDQAENATRTPFRRCYHEGLLYDPTQDGHVAVVLRVGRTGRVASAEIWGACDLTPKALECMREEAARLRLRPPETGSATVTIPAVFTSAESKRRGPNDAYAAAAYVAIESMRPRLHACEETAKRSGTGVFASATMAIDIDERGHGVHVAVEPWSGAQGLLGCAAEVVRDAPFPPPPAGKGKVIVPMVFNPRPGTR